jgi:hypothetical protein
MRVACGGSLSPPLVSDSTRNNVSRRNSTKTLQKDFRRLEEIYDQKLIHLFQALEMSIVW